MTLKRVKVLADFFFSSESTRDIPLRISCVTGRYTGFDLERAEFESLFKILSKSQNLRKDLAGFLERVYDQKE